MTDYCLIRQWATETGYGDDDIHYAVMHYSDAAGAWVDIATTDDWLTANFLQSRLNLADRTEARIEFLEEYVRTLCMENHKAPLEACERCKEVLGDDRD